MTYRIYHSEHIVECTRLTVCHGTLFQNGFSRLSEHSVRAVEVVVRLQVTPGAQHWCHRNRPISHVIQARNRPYINASPQFSPLFQLIPDSHYCPPVSASFSFAQESTASPRRMSTQRPVSSWSARQVGNGEGVLFLTRDGTFPCILL